MSHLRVLSQGWCRTGGVSSCRTEQGPLCTPGQGIPGQGTDFSPCQTLQDPSGVGRTVIPLKIRFLHFKNNV